MIMHTSRLQRPSPQVVISIILVKKKKKKKARQDVVFEYRFSKNVQSWNVIVGCIINSKAGIISA